MEKRSKLVIFAILFILSACVKPAILPKYVDRSQDTPYTVLQFPPIEFDNVIWRTDGVIIAFPHESTRPLKQPYGLENDNALQYLNLEQDPKCTEITSYDFPTQLPDGRLGLLKTCVTDNFFTTFRYMVAYDWKTQRLEQIVQKHLVHSAISHCFDWNQNMTKGIQLTSNGLNGTLNWLSRIQPEPINIILKDGKHIWDLPKSTDEHDPMQDGQISCPSWSPQNDTIAIFVSFDAIGIDGMNRIDAPYQLALISSTGENSNFLLRGIYHPKDTKFSKDGKMIAFSGEISNQVEGLWIFDLNSSSLMLLGKGYIEDLSWSPDSKHLAVIWCEKMLSENCEIRKYSLPK